MSTFKKLLTRFNNDEHGMEVLEYAIILSLLVIGALIALTAFAPHVVAKWTGIREIL